VSITVNNNSIDFVEQETIEDLLKRLKFTFPLIIVKINGKHIPRDSYHEVIIQDNADIKIIHMISGG
jgi:thiamine biosynthesis protein ThiS